MKEFHKLEMKFQELPQIMTKENFKNVLEN